MTTESSDYMFNNYNDLPQLSPREIADLDLEIDAALKGLQANEALEVYAAGHGLRIIRGDVPKSPYRIMFDKVLKRLFDYEQ